MAYIIENEGEEVTLGEGDIVILQSDGWDDVLKILAKHAGMHLNYNLERVMEELTTTHLEIIREDG